MDLTCICITLNTNSKEYTQVSILRNLLRNWPHMEAGRSLWVKGQHGIKEIIPGQKLQWNSVWKMEKIKIKRGDREMAECLKTLPAFTKVMSSITDKHMVAHKHM